MYHLLDVNEFGWKVVDGCLEIDWDDSSNFEQVKESVHLLLKGCGCKKGCCNNRCSCFKAGVKCGLDVDALIVRTYPISLMTTE